MMSCYVIMERVTSARVLVTRFASASDGAGPVCDNHTTGEHN